MRIGIGDISRGMFVVPQNPVGMGAFIQSRYNLPQTGLGCADDCTDCAACRKKHGMGDLSDTIASINWTDFTDPTTLTAYAVIGGGFLLLSSLFTARPRGYRKARREAIQGARKRYPTVAERARRAAGAF
jgi:hypothetical protein